MLSAGRVVQIGLPAAALFGSFFITLWLTAPDSPGTQPIGGDNRSDAEKLAAFHVSDVAELSKAAYEIGLHPSRRMNGNVDVINKTSEHGVTIAGWVADTEGDATPTNVVVFAGGAMVATTQTKGERPDVTQALHLDFGSEKNVSFSVEFSCRPGDQPVIAAIAATKRYLPLKSLPCP